MFAGLHNQSPLITMVEPTNWAVGRSWKSYTLVTFSEFFLHQFEDRFQVEEVFLERTHTELKIKRFEVGLPHW